MLKFLQWLLYSSKCPLFVPGYFGSNPSSANRWRTLFWAVASCLVWLQLEVTWFNFFAVSLLPVLLAAIFMVVTNQLHVSRSDVGSLLTLAACLGFVNGLVVLTSFPLYMRYEYLAKKIVWREAHLFQRWCPNTYVTVSTVCLITLLVKGLRVSCWRAHY
ncbi:uncharacterized protein LOC101857085 [Aplysia californica]|uniref:Uncharacterized protein LOC101857085 n=1 Tax=Aplysia californica TaxID=6500 RepID=A0ABM0JD41_APLCA|nr:uncharacterized protein LOC101857085 [Aplysia californica]